MNRLQCRIFDLHRFVYIIRIVPVWTTNCGGDQAENTVNALNIPCIWLDFHYSAGDKRCKSPINREITTSSSILHTIVGVMWLFHSPFCIGGYDVLNPEHPFYSDINMWMILFSASRMWEVNDGSGLLSGGFFDKWLEPKGDDKEMDDETGRKSTKEFICIAMQR